MEMVEILKDLCNLGVCLVSECWSVVII